MSDEIKIKVTEETVDDWIWGIFDEDDYEFSTNELAIVRQNVIDQVKGEIQDNFLNDVYQYLDKNAVLQGSGYKGNEEESFPDPEWDPVEKIFKY
jgi:hypothetical protein